MRNKRVVAIAAFLVMLGTLKVFAMPITQNLPYISLSDFLAELEISFDEYYAAFAAFEEAGILPHYLEENSARYDSFRKSNPGITEDAAIAYVNVNVDYGPYANISEVPEAELSSVTTLVNKNFGLPANWSADDMVDIGSGFMVREEASVFLLEMREAMKASGLSFNLMCTYRAYASSARLHSEAVAKWGETIADLNWARGGHSEHQTALSADILHRTDTPTLTEARFETTEEYKWLSENAHEYGFILRYPREYEDITGYKFEPWHWRYIGIDAATLMYAEGIAVYEEFYGKYLASAVLHNVRELILEQRALAEAEELERLEREALERQAEETAEREALEAALLEEEALREAKADAEREALEVAEAVRLATIAESKDAAKTLIKERNTTLAVMATLSVAIICTVIIMRVLYNRKREHQKKGYYGGN